MRSISLRAALPAFASLGMAFSSMAHGNAGATISTATGAAATTTTATAASATTSSATAASATAATAASATAPLPLAAAEPPARPRGLGAADRFRGDEPDAPVDLVAFTFDDGPDPATTPLVLDALARYHIPAAFFVVTRHIVGRRAAAGLPLVAREVAEGHLIGSHTANHARLRHPGKGVLQRELDDSLALLRAAAGTPIELFRPPYGVLGTASAQRVRDLGLTDVRWSIDQKDFQNKDGDALRRNVVADILSERGGVVLLHDTKRVTARSISRLFDDLERANCRRLAAHKPAVIPVSLHYFLRDQGVARAIPAEVLERTTAYRAYLTDRCEERTSTSRAGKKPRSGPAPRPDDPAAAR